ncbi:MAG: glycoside hydrolase family 99-like domain-containing protein [Treponema sp.]|nr:glycoside hydrolase family 99-like domain-containing protein [Treponema sp.]
MKKTKLLAFYLPQFHPTPENDEWWGKGFTEWTNVGKAKPLFPGHYQPRVPADLGYYDLRLPDVRQAQAELAREAGIDGFCYWHYWFEPGKELLQGPFDEVVASGSPDFPFCLAWANHSWYAKTWNKDKSQDKLLIEQKYCGVEDYKAHFYRLLASFKDSRYIKENGKPVFVIYSPLDSSEIKNFISTWQELAKKEGFPGIYFIAHNLSDRKELKKYYDLGFDSVNNCIILGKTDKNNFFAKIIKGFMSVLLKLPKIYNYKKLFNRFFDIEIDSSEKICPSIIAGWDHTPRSGRKGVVLTNYTPDNLYELSYRVLSNTQGPFVFVKSWNEWAEGNYLEPDLRNGKDYIYALKKAVENTSK